MLEAILLFIMLLIFYFKFLRDDDIVKKNPKLAISGYKVIYTDQKKDFDPTKVVVSEILKSTKYDLRGKPDFIFMNDEKKLIPVELKSGKIGDKEAPYYNDLMQLVAYFLMIEDVFSIVPKQGRIIYKDHMFVIKNTRKLQEELFQVLENMRQMLEDGIAEPNNSFVRCRHCFCNKTVCEFTKEKE